MTEWSKTRYHYLLQFSSISFWLCKNFTLLMVSNSPAKERMSEWCLLSFLPQLNQYFFLSDRIFMNLCSPFSPCTVHQWPLSNQLRLFFFLTNMMIWILPCRRVWSNRVLKLKTIEHGGALVQLHACTCTCMYVLAGLCFYRKFQSSENVGNMGNWTPGDRIWWLTRVHFFFL